jgi:DNA-binding beta-propeller fold protein YncE
MGPSLAAMARAAGTAAALAAVLAATLAGCSAGNPRPALSGAPATPGGAAAAGSGAATAAGPPLAVTVGAPGCTTAAAPGPALRGVPTPMVSLPATPFGVTVSPDGRWAFVALTGAASVGVFRITGPGAPSLVRRVKTGQQPVGEALTPDGRYLLAADNADGAAVISVGGAESGAAGALVGTLGDGSPAGAIEVAVSPGGRFAFVSLEASGSIAVYNLGRALADGFHGSDLVGMIPTGIAPVGMAVSPDGRWLYATSEVEASATGPVRGTVGGPGMLSVIDLHRAETDPAGSVVSTVVAGCSPVRVITSANGGVVWVTARGSDCLLGFSAARLRTDPARSLVASVPVGEAPVGLTLVGGGNQVVVTDSNRFGGSGAASSLAVVDVAAALAGRPALVGYLRAGGFPREMALEPDGRTLLVGNFTSQQLEAVDVAELP